MTRPARAQGPLAALGGALAALAAGCLLGAWLAAVPAPATTWAAFSGSAVLPFGTVTAAVPAATGEASAARGPRVTATAPPTPGPTAVPSVTDPPAPAAEPGAATATSPRTTTTSAAPAVPDPGTATTPP